MAGFHCNNFKWSTTYLLLGNNGGNGEGKNAFHSPDYQVSVYTEIDLKSVTTSILPLLIFKMRNCLN